MKLALILMVALAIPAFAQTSHKVEVFSSKDVQAQLAALVQKSKTTAGGSGSATLGEEYDTHFVRLVARTSNGGAELHTHYDDVMIVEKGTATLITGGKLVNAQTHDNGEMTGTGIVAGQVQTISAGDIVHVPAETPHQIMVRDGSDFRAIVIKVKE